MEKNSGSLLITEKSLTNALDNIEESYISYPKKRKSRFKKALINSLFFYDRHPEVLTLFKVITGFIVLGIPAIVVFVLVRISNPVPTKYLVLPFIVTITFCVAGLVMIVIIKVRYNVIQSGLLISSWERAGIFKLIGSLIINCFIIAILMRIETICISCPFYQGNVSQFEAEEFPGKKLRQGSFLFRLIFIGFFWNSSKAQLGSFSIDTRFLNEFKADLSKLFKSFLAIALYYLIKIIFIKSKNTLVYSIITLVTIYECFLFIYYPIDSDYQETNPFFFKYSKFFEVIPLFFLLFSYGWIAIKNNIIKLIRKKLYSYRTKKKTYSTISVVLVLFGSIAVGLTILLYVLMHLLFVNTEPFMKYERFNHIMSFLLYGLFIVVLGSIFQFGDYHFSLVYKPIVYEFCQAVQKNYYYIRTSNNLARKKKKRHNMKEKVLRISTKFDSM